MKKGQIIFLIILLAVLVGLVVLKKKQTPPELTQEEYAEVALDFQQGQDAQTIEIFKGAEEQPTLRLARSGENWSMPLRWELPVQKTKIDDAFGMLKNLKGELRGSDEKLFPDFEIEDEKAYHIKIKGAEDKELLHLLLGNKRPKYGSNFIRLGGSPKVFLVNFNLMVTFGINTGDVTTINEKQWVDLKLTDFNNSDITGIKIENRSESSTSPRIVELSKSVDPSGVARWSFARQDLPFSVDAEKVSKYLDDVKQLTGTDFHDPAGTAYGFENFNAQVTLNADAEDKKRVLTMGEVSSSDSESRYVRIAQGKPVFTLSKYSINNVLVDEGRFFPANPLGIDKEKVTSILIHKPDSEKKIEGDTFEQEAGTIDALKEFSVARLLNDSESKKVKPSGERWIEVVPKEGQTVQVDVGDVLDEKNEEYAARLRNGTTAFAISKSVYERLFES